VGPLPLPPVIKAGHQSLILGVTGLVVMVLVMVVMAVLLSLLKQIILLNKKEETLQGSNAFPFPIPSNLPLYPCNWPLGKNINSVPDLPV
jgi:hypothetical protein